MRFTFGLGTDLTEISGGTALMYWRQLKACHPQSQKSSFARIVNGAIGMMPLMVIDIVTAWRQKRQEEQRMTFAVMRKGKRNEAN